MYQELEIKTFLDKARRIPVVDVRTPGEFRQGHIPGATNMPLFTNEERKIVGTSYKDHGRERAVVKGLEFVQSRLTDYVDQARSIAVEKTILLHCWRGGYRSASLAWLFDMAGYSTYVLKGGYKSYRNHIRGVFDSPLKLAVLGGLTGSGKTALLRELSTRGEQIIDLEALAVHRGSAFGNFPGRLQPTNEQFENDLSAEIMKLNPSRRVWIEDESRNIGLNQIPAGLFQQIRNSYLVFIDSNPVDRVQRLVDEYSLFDDAYLEQSILKISKKLGGLMTRKAIRYLQTKDYYSCAGIVLSYYDKTYRFGLEQRSPEKIITLIPEKNDPRSICRELLESVPGQI